MKILDGQGSFSDIQTIDEEKFFGYDVATADLDSDGDLDVLSSFDVLSEINWYRNVGFIGNVINGTVRLDLDGNGCSADDQPVQDILVSSNNATDVFGNYSLLDGSYELVVGAGAYTTQLTPPNYFMVDPVSVSSTFTGLNNTETIDFCLSPEISVNDLTVSLYPTGNLAAGFTATYQLVLFNAGTEIMSGEAVLEFDDAAMEFQYASEMPSDQSNNSLTFAFNDLLPLQSHSITLNFGVFPPPAVDLGDIITTTATIFPVAGDNTPADNEFILDETVVGSFDPNDIQVLEGPEITLEQADDYLHYIIRFQNTGTAPASFVRVENTLDPNLDWASLQVESVSHAYEVEVLNGNEVSFNFENIQLPDSTNNEPESHGFICYRILPKSGLDIGAKMSNEASIYFDFNAPIETNTVITEIVELLVLHENEKLQLSYYPNPVGDILHLVSPSEIVFVQVFDQFGRSVLQSSQGQQVNVSGLPAGVYYARVEDQKGTSGVLKFVKK